MRGPLLILLFALPVLAQPPAAPEIRGNVVEVGSNTPIPGAEVTLYEFAPNADNFVVRTAIATTSSGSNGAFTLKPTHLGNFIVGATKDGYSGPNRGGAQTNFTLNAENPIQNIRLSLNRPGTLTGRVIDRDGNPVANLRVGIDMAPARFGSGLFAVTNAEGVFTALDLSPGSYVVHIQPSPKAESDDLPEFTEAAFKIIEEDVEPGYWPGGVADPDLALPIPVAGGAIANAGTITVRKVPYYRVHVSVAGRCSPNERWVFRVLPAGDDLVPVDDQFANCREEFLLTRIPPGSYRLVAWHAYGRDILRWAITPFIVTKENTNATLIFTETTGVSGRVTAAEGADLSKLGGVQILLRPSGNLPPGNPFAQPDAAGKFSFGRVPWNSQLLSVDPIEATTNVREIRYNGLPLRGQQLDTIPGATLEIVLDNKAAIFTGQLKRGDAATSGHLFLFRASMTEPLTRIASFAPFSFGAEIRSDGRFRIGSIPPGDYRILALPLEVDEDFTDANVLNAFLARAEKITLGPGEQKSLDVQLK